MMMMTMRRRAGAISVSTTMERIEDGTKQAKCISLINSINLYEPCVVNQFAVVIVVAVAVVVDGQSWLFRCIGELALCHKLAVLCWTGATVSCLVGTFTLSTDRLCWNTQNSMRRPGFTLLPVHDWLPLPPVPSSSTIGIVAGRMKQCTVFQCTSVPRVSEA